MFRNKGFLLLMMVSGLLNAQNDSLFNSKVEIKLNLTSALVLVPNIGIEVKLSEKLSIDAQVLNGEGYKKAQGENGLFRGGLGLTYTMSESLALRVNRDINPRASYGTDDASQHITALAITYSGNNFNLGADKSVMTNAGNQIAVLVLCLKLI